MVSSWEIWADAPKPTLNLVLPGIMGKWDCFITKCSLDQGLSQVWVIPNCSLHSWITAWLKEVSLEYLLWDSPKRKKKNTFNSVSTNFSKTNFCKTTHWLCFFDGLHNYFSVSLSDIRCLSSVSLNSTFLIRGRTIPLWKHHVLICSWVPLTSPRSELLGDQPNP